MRQAVRYLRRLGRIRVRSARFNLQAVKARDIWHLTNRINRKLLAHTLAFLINRHSFYPLRFEQPEVTSVGHILSVHLSHAIDLEYCSNSS